MTRIIHRTLLLGQEGEKGFFEARRFISQLSILWKFEYTIRFFPEHDIPVKCNSFSNAIIIYTSKDESYENWLLEILNSENIVEVLLIDAAPKLYSKRMMSRFGVQGIEHFVSNRRIKLERLESDPILRSLEGILYFQRNGLESSGRVKVDKADPLIGQSANICFLSRSTNVEGTYYCTSLPIWQIGVPAFPAFFYVIRNFLFFNRAMGFFSPKPVASLRVDDYPITSQQYLRAKDSSDAYFCLEIDTLCNWSAKYDAHLEFMVSSHVPDENLNLKVVTSAVPKSCERLRDYYRKGFINVNAHGRSHIDEEKYRKTREISPMEFKYLNIEQTEKHLGDNIKFMKQYFEKLPVGFVAPSWGYHENITKAVCAKLFSFVIDSSRNFRTVDDCMGTGDIDEQGLLHLIETWHLGANGIDYYDRLVWRAYLDNGIPIHMMVHGPYIYDPIPKSKSAMFIVLFVSILISPLLVVIAPREVIRIIKSLFSPIKWNRLGFLRRIMVGLPFFKRASVENLLRVGNKYNVKWMFTEKLADLLRDYAHLQIIKYEKSELGHSIQFYLKKNDMSPFYFHSPFVIVAALIDNMPIDVSDNRQVLEISNLLMGNHELVVRGGE